MYLPLTLFKRTLIKDKIVMFDCRFSMTYWKRVLLPVGIKTVQSSIFFHFICCRRGWRRGACGWGAWVSAASPRDHHPSSDLGWLLIISRLILCVHVKSSRKPWPWCCHTRSKAVAYISLPLSTVCPSVRPAASFPRARDHSSAAFSRRVGSPWNYGPGEKVGFGREKRLM